MVTKIKVIIGSGLAGWLVMILWSVMSYVRSSSSCHFLSRFNLIEAPGAAIFFTFAVIFFVISSLYTYKLFKDTAELESLKNKKWPLVASVVFLAFAVLVPSLNTHDINYYFSAGKAVTASINPFIDSWEMTNGYFCPRATNEFSGIMYGPITVALFGVISSVTGGSAVLFILLWKVLMLFCFLVFAVITWSIIRLLSIGTIEKKSLFLLLSSQPVFVWYWIGNGQFDVLWVIFVLLAVLCSIKKYWFLVFTFLVIGIWIKFIPLLMVPWFVLWWWQETNKLNWKKNVGHMLASIFVAVACTYAVWKPFWAGLTVFNTILLQSKWAVNSLFATLYYTFKPLFAIFLDGNAHWWLTRLLHAALLVFLLYLMYPLLKKAVLIMLKKTVWSPVNYVAAIFISMIIFLAIWQKSFWPWYLSWLLPLAIVLFITTPSVWLQKILVWLSTIPLGFYIVWIINHVTRGTDAPSELWFYYIIFGITWAYPLLQLVKWRKSDYSLTGMNINSNL